MRGSIKLLDEIIELEKERDNFLKGMLLAHNKGYLTLGDSKIMFYLKQLKELIQKESQTINIDIISIPEGYYGPIGDYNLDNWPKNGTYLFPVSWVEKKVNFKRENENIGKRVRVNKKAGDWEGREGIITDHYLCGDDCSGSFGKEKYAILDNSDKRWSLTTDCFELIS